MEHSGNGAVDGIESGGTPVARPLFEAACLVGLGSWAGSAAPEEWASGEWVGPGSTALLLGIVGALARGRLLRSVRLLLFAAALLRAGLAPGTHPEAFVPGPPPSAETSTHPDMVALRGPWDLRSRGTREDYGQVVDPRNPGAARRIPSGSVRDGEGVVLLGPSRPVRAVQAPRPRDSASAGTDPDDSTRPDDPTTPSELRPGGPAPILSRHHALDTIVRVTPSPWPSSPFEPSREWLLDRLGRLDRERTGPLTRALLLGDSRSLPTELKDLFTRLGLRHLLALSGLHVGLLAVLLGRALGALVPLVTGQRLRGSAAVWIRALPILIYIPLAGAGAPVTRAGAALVLSAWAGSVDGGRRPDGRSLWGAALLYECTVDPGAGSRLSVQLSYLATLGLMTLAGPWARRIDSCFRTSPRHLGPQGKLAVWGRALGVRIRQLLVHGTAASLAASLPTAPLVLEAFGEWSPIGLLATAPCVPALGLVLAGGWCEVLVPGSMGPALGSIIAIFVGVLEHLDRLPATPQVLPLRPFLATAAVVVLFARHIGGRPLGGRMLRLAQGLAGALILPWAAAPSGLTVDAVDVGHGTAILLRAPGVGTWIFDAGSRGRRGVDRRGLLPFLRAHEVVRPIVSLSHLHRDHASALPWIVERFPPRLWVGPVPPELVERLPVDCQRLDPPPPGGPLPTPGPLEIELLRGSTTPGNEGSRSLSIRLGDRHLVLCGDAEGEGLARVLRGGHLSAPVHLLLLPHHGSDGPNLGRLLGILRPEEVWISADPLPPVLPELDRRGIPWRCTSVHGPLHWPRAGIPSEDAHSGSHPRGVDGPPGIPGGTEDASSLPEPPPPMTPRGSEATRSDPTSNPTVPRQNHPPGSSERRREPLGSLRTSGKMMDGNFRRPIPGRGISGKILESGSWKWDSKRIAPQGL